MSKTSKTRLFHADCREVLAKLDENSIDAVVTDPPYHLTSIVKRFGGENAAPAQFGKDGAYARASVGFMGQKWDGGDVAFRPETWAAVYRVLKPGGHMLVFGGTRTYHRLACAIEDAGFEVRDAVMWHYGSGFPKSHDVSKGIDQRGGKQVGWFGQWLRAWREQNGIKQSDVAALFPSKTGGKTGCVANWELGFNLPTPEQFNAICRRFGLPFESLEAAEREIIGRSNNGIAPNWAANGDAGFRASFDLTTPATNAAKQWEGYGTALKPATEIVCLARKPLSEGTVAANVLRWGTGALNIDKCRVASPDAQAGRVRHGDGSTWEGSNFIDGNGELPAGRWPANVAHDGSDEVVAGFPESDHARGNITAKRSNRKPSAVQIAPMVRYEPGWAGDSGSAARFFYQAKANKHDRAGSSHPTVKPVSLIRWLVRMITPPNGVVLDPFAGSGTTGEAAFREGFRSILIEREKEYVIDIKRRMRLVFASKGEDKKINRKRLVVKGNPLHNIADSKTTSTN